MSLMSEALERISTYCNLTQSGRSRENVERQLSVFPFQLADEVYEYYQWAGAPTGDRCLTNMMLAIAESLETLRSIYPPSIPPDEDGDTYLDLDEEKERWKTLAAITKKYGSSKGVIITN